MEQPIDFSRDRRMLCRICAHQRLVDLEWIDRWEQGSEVCPRCGTTSEHEDAPRVTVDPDNLALDDGKIAQFAWYHTSTRPDWPTRDFDPAAGLTPEMRTIIGGAQRVAASAREGPPCRYERIRSPQMRTPS